MSEREFGLREIGQVAMPVEDLEEAVAFYRDTLGMSFLFQVPGMAFFDCGGVRLLLGLPEEGQEKLAASILYFRVEDIGRAHRTLVDRGVDFRVEPRRVAELEDHDLWLAFFHDSEGHTLALMSEVAKA